MTEPRLDRSERLADEVRLRRVVDGFRCASLVYAVLLFQRDAHLYRHPAGGWLVLAALAGWSAVLALQARRPQRPAALRVADLAVACAAVVATRFLDDPGRVAAGATTLPAIWPASAVLSWAIWRGWRTGLAAAATVSLADLVENGFRFGDGTVNNIVLLLLTGLVAGYAVDVMRAGQRDLARATAVEAATRERERLAADIHDSVLQVLAYVRRRGGEAGGEAAELGRLAGEQEARLRALVATGPGVRTGPDGGDGDLRATLGLLARAGVQVTGPAEPVLLPPQVVHALTSATAAALDNVARHAGPGAGAWVLLEEEPEVVTVTVRDDGAGMPAGRPDAAAREGRLGLVASIRGRVADVGGSVTVVSTPGEGTEVEMRVPRLGHGRRP